MDDIIASVQKMYDEAGEYFSKTREKTYGQKSSNWPETQQYLDGLRSGQAILDVGCGGGRLLSGLGKKVDYLGIDFSKTLIAIARKKYPEREFRQANIVEEKGWKDLADKYDAVFCVATLHHVPTREQQIFVLDKMREAAKARGLLFLTVWNLWQNRFLQAHLDSAELKKIDGKYVKVPFDNKWDRFCVAMDLPYLVQLMEDSGWETEEVYYAGSTGERTDVLSGKNLVVVARKRK